MSENGMRENPYVSPPQVVEDETSVHEYLRRIRWVRWGLGVLWWSVLLAVLFYAAMFLGEGNDGVPTWDSQLKDWLLTLSVIPVLVIAVAGIIAYDMCPKEVLSKRGRWMGGTLGGWWIPLQFLAISAHTEKGFIVMHLLFWGGSILWGLGIRQLARGLECQRGVEQGTRLMRLAILFGVAVAATIGVVRGLGYPIEFIAHGGYNTAALAVMLVQMAGLLVFGVLLMRALSTLRRWMQVEILDKSDEVR